MDPRTSIIDRRLSRIKNIVAVSGGKGGVGKSMVSCALALLLAKQGKKVGLFDMDFTSPSTHTILGVRNIYPEEKNGLIPPEVMKIKYMSIVYYSMNHPAPLRGSDMSDALIELFAVTLWDDLDYLIIDMPPGISDAVLDMLRFVKNIKFLLVTTPSVLAFDTTRKLSVMLSQSHIPVMGVIENMKMKESSIVENASKSIGLDYLGFLPFDKDLEESIGNAEKLMSTRFAKGLENIINKKSE